MATIERLGSGLVFFRGFVLSGFRDSLSARAGRWFFGSFLSRFLSWNFCPFLAADFKSYNRDLIFDFRSQRSRFQSRLACYNEG